MKTANHVIRNIRRYLILLPVLLFTSCIDLLEELTLRSDGRGSYHLTLDMSKFMKDELLKSMLMSDSVQWQSMKQSDTLIHLGDRATGPDSAFWKKVRMRLQVSEADEQFTMRIMLDFDSVDDIAYMLEHIDKVDSSMGAGASGANNNLLPRGLRYRLVGRELQRETDAAKEGQDDSESAMLAMMMSDATHKLFVQLPGKVRQTTIANAKVEDNKVTATAPMADILSGKNPLDGVIRY